MAKKTPNRILTKNQAGTILGTNGLPITAAPPNKHYFLTYRDELKEVTKGAFEIAMFEAKKALLKVNPLVPSEAGHAAYFLCMASGSDMATSKLKDLKGLKYAVAVSDYQYCSVAVVMDDYLVLAANCDALLMPSGLNISTNFRQTYGFVLGELA